MKWWGVICLERQRSDDESIKGWNSNAEFLVCGGSRHKVVLPNYD